MELDRDALYTYVGTFDDIVIRYPWRFRIDADYIQYCLAFHWITGRKILLNDGYLLNNDLLRDALRNDGHLLRLLIAQGTVLIASRGYRYAGPQMSPIREFGLHETPERMQHIPSFERILKSGVDGEAWPVFRRRLELVDQELFDRSSQLPWSPYDTSSGYLAFAKKLMDDRSTSSSVGLGRMMATRDFHLFLRMFHERIASDLTKGPRSVWEEIARSFAEDPDVTNVPSQTLQALMRLSNEIYHYNFGSGLAAAFEMRIAVETQPSAAFDDLLLTREMRLEKLADFPVPFVPREIAAVPPAKLVGAFLQDARLGDARNDFIELNRQARNHASIPTHLSVSLKSASDLLSREIARVFGRNIRNQLGQGAFDVIYSEIAKPQIKGLVTGGVGLATGMLTHDPVLSAGGMVGTALLAYWAGNKLKPVAAHAYKLVLDNAPDVSPELIRRSTQVMNAIKRQKTPISLEMQPLAARRLVDQMRLFP